jgi:hypothetical protein
MQLLISCGSFEDMQRAVPLQSDVKIMGRGPLGFPRVPRVSIEVAESTNAGTEARPTVMSCCFCPHQHSCMRCTTENKYQQQQQQERATHLTPAVTVVQSVWWKTWTYLSAPSNKIPLCGGTPQIQSVPSGVGLQCGSSGICLSRNACHGPGLLFLSAPNWTIHL